MAEYAGQIRIKASIECKSINTELAKIEAAMQKLAHKIEETRLKLKAFEDTKVPTDEYRKLEEELSLAGKRLDYFIEESNKLAKSGITEGDLYEKSLDNIMEADKAMDEIRAKMQRLESVGKRFRFIDEKQLNEYKALKNLISEYEADMNALAKKADHVAEKLTMAGRSSRGNTPDADLTSMERTSETLHVMESEIADINKIILKYLEEADKIDDPWKRLEEIQRDIAQGTQEAVSNTKTQKEVQEAVTREVRESAAALKEQNKILNQRKSGTGTQLVKNEKAVQKELKKTGKTAENMHKSYEKGAKKTNKSIKRFSMSIKDILVNAFLFNWVFMFFQNLSNAIKDTFNQFIEADKEAAESMKELKSSTSDMSAAFISMLMPALEKAMPMITYLSNGLSDAFDKAGMFFAALAGEDYYKRLKKGADDTANAVSGIGNAAKDSKNQLAGFDDLDVLSQRTNTSFSEMELDPEIAKHAIEIRNIMDDIGDVIPLVTDEILDLGDAFVDGFKFGVGDNVLDQLDRISDKAADAGASIIEVFSNPELQRSVNGFVEESAETLGTLTGTGTRVGLNLGEHIIGALSYALKSRKKDMQEDLTEVFDIGAVIHDAIQRGLRALGIVSDSVVTPEAERVSGELVGIFTTAGLDITKLSAKMGRDGLELFIDPIADNADDLRQSLTETYGILGNLAEGVGDLVEAAGDDTNRLYDEIVEPVMDSMATHISETLSEMSEEYNQNWAPMLNDLTEDLRGVFSEDVVETGEALVDAFVAGKNALGELFEVADPFFENTLKPMADIFLGAAKWNIDLLVKQIEFGANLITKMAEGAELLFNKITEGIQSIKEQFNGFEGFEFSPLSNIASGGVGGSLFSTVDKLKGAGSIVKDLLNTPLYTTNSQMIPATQTSSGITNDQFYELLDVARNNTTTPSSITAVIDLDGREVGRGIFDYLQEESVRRGK